MDLAAVQRRYYQALAADIGVDVEQFDRPSTLVFAETGRAGSGMVVAYEINKFTGLRTDPALADALAAVEDQRTSLGLQGFGRWVAQCGWEVVDGGDSHLVTADLLVHKELPADATLILLDRASQFHVELITDLIEASDTDDVDAAEIELADLDPQIFGLVDRDGRLGAYASGRRWEEDEGFDDLGVLTRTDLRGRGWGGGVVSALCRHSFAVGRLPLYRCNWSRGPSKALALSLGFRRVNSLLAAKPAA